MLILPFLCLPWALTLLLDMEEQSLLAEHRGAWTVLSLLGRGMPSANLHLLSLLPRRGFVDSVLLWLLKK